MLLECQRARRDGLRSRRLSRALGIERQSLRDPFPATVAAPGSGLHSCDPGYEIYDDLDVQPDDLIIPKRRFSALVQGSSTLNTVIRQKGIDTLVIVGTATNVCCESTIRDGMMTNYKCIMVSDANACRTDEEHNATLATVAILFGDVRPTNDVITMLATGSNA